ncbi:hypothetical protein RJ640_027912 [Escallonia rubra]|uniref:Uncharacterized protein n=1 Tax=Escallonia rubra TaxID=112253 RepID=A0AA88RMA7_9ASTE|nr:hypothetical protein RJ640_027912 [Escallonia rubra]
MEQATQGTPSSSTNDKYSVLRIIAKSIENSDNFRAGDFNDRGLGDNKYGTTSIVTPMGDVYSYGILLMETFTRKKPT